MTTLREAAQQALEALEAMNPYPASREDQRAGALTALRAALAQQDEPCNLSDRAVQKRLAAQWGYVPAQQAEPVEPVEPVAWTGYDLEGMVEAFSRVIEAHHSSKHPFHNPIDMDAKMALRILRGFIPAMKAYATPPQRKPLTEEEIHDRFHAARNAKLGASLDNSKHRLSVVEIARAIERAHGIGGSND